MSHYTVMEVRGRRASPGELTSPGAGGGGPELPWIFPPQPTDFLHRETRAEEMSVGVASQGARAFVSVQARTIRKSQDQEAGFSSLGSQKIHLGALTGKFLDSEVLSLKG